jgi:hypothetical protein
VQHFSCGWQKNWLLKLTAGFNRAAGYPGFRKVPGFDQALA